MERAEAHQRLVLRIARRYRGLGVSLEDLVQEGNLGLLQAVVRFDPRRGFRFSTYAAFWIRQAILRSVRDDGNLVRLPAHIAIARDRLRSIERRLTARHGRDPTVAELAAATGLPEWRIVAAQRRQEVCSLDAPRDTGDRPLSETLADPGGAGATAVDRLLARETRGELARAIARLRPLEAEVVRRRFGFVDEEERTRADLARAHRLTRERIRQIERGALDKLRRWLTPRAASCA